MFHRWLSGSSNTNAKLFCCRRWMAAAVLLDDRGDVFVVQLVHDVANFTKRP